MRTAMLTKWDELKLACTAVNDALWANAFKTPETRALAEVALDKLQDKAERVIRVLKWRYAIEVR